MSGNHERAASGLTRGGHAVFVIVTLFYWICLYIYVPIQTTYIESLGASPFFVGVALGSYGFVQMLVRLPLGIRSDRKRVRKPYIMLGMATGALSCLLFVIDSSYGWSLAAKAMAGVSASTWVAFTVLYASYYAKEEATKAMGVISFLTVSGQLIGMGLSGLFAEIWNIHAVFWAGALLGVIGLAVSYGIREPKDGIYRAPIQMKDLTAVMKEGTLLQVSLLSILAHSILFITMFGFTPSYAAQLGASSWELSLVSVSFMVPHAIAALLTGKRFAPRFGAWNVVIVGFIASTACTLAIPFAGTLGWLMFTQSLNGFAQGLHLPLLLGLAIQSIEQQKRATAMGFYQAVYALGMFGGPFLAGWLNEFFGLSGGFYFGSILGLTAAVLTARWTYQRTRAKRTYSHSA